MGLQRVRHDLACMHAIPWAFIIPVSDDKISYLNCWTAWWDRASMIVVRMGQWLLKGMRDAQGDSWWVSMESGEESSWRRGCGVLRLQLESSQRHRCAYTERRWQLGESHPWSGVKERWLRGGLGCATGYVRERTPVSHGVENDRTHA